MSATISLRDPDKSQLLVEGCPSAIKEVLRTRYIQLCKKNQDLEFVIGVTFWRFIAIYQAFMSGLTMEDVKKQTGLDDTDLEYLLSEAMGVVNGR